MGVASMVLGIISIIFSIFCGCISMITSPIGLILGIIDLVLKSSKQNELTGEVVKEDKKMAIAGIVMCSIAIIILIFITIIAYQSGTLDSFMEGYNSNY